MHRSPVALATILLLLALPAVSLSGTAQDDVLPRWNTAWSYQQELRLPITTSDSTARYQPIDLRITFENPCWSEDENRTSIRICCWHHAAWHELESQIYNLKTDSSDPTHITACNVVFLIPTYADGTERYFLYYHDHETTCVQYTDHVSVKDAYYSSSPLPDVSAQATYYGVTEDGCCLYAVGQEGNLLDRSISQVVVKQKKGAHTYDLLGADQIVSFAFSYYYGSKEKDESSSDQTFIDKKIFVDGNLMVQFGIISESKKKDIRTTALYKYYYYPVDDKKIDVSVKHEMLQEATVEGIENIDGRFGSIIQLKSKSASIDALNFGQIPPYLNFYDKNDIIKEYQMNQDPATKDREWIIPFRNDEDLGAEAWLCAGDGKAGKASAVIFSSNKGIVTSGTDEHDGIQIKVTEKEYFNFLGTEVDYASINFGRNSYEPGQSHDIMIPSDLVVNFNAEVYYSEHGGYEAVQHESRVYQTLVQSRSQFGDTPFERQLHQYNLTVITRFGGTHLSFPRLANLTARLFPVMWIELHREGQLIAAGAANRSVFTRASKTFYETLEGEYLVKVFWKRGNSTKMFTGATVVVLDKDKTVIVRCTWQRTITILFLDQQGNGIPGIHGSVTNRDGVLFDDNTTPSTGELLLKVPYNPQDPYTVHAEYKDFVVYDKELQQTLKRYTEDVTLELYTITITVTDTLGLPPGVSVTPMLLTTSEQRAIQLTPADSGEGQFVFERIPAGEYILQLTYGDFIDTQRVTIPNSSDHIRMEFTASFQLTIDLLDSKGNVVTQEGITFVVLRDGLSVTRTQDRIISLPPARYTIQAYCAEELIGEKDLELTNDRHLTFVTTLESLVSLLVSLFLFGLFCFFLGLTLLKKFSVSSLLKCLVILLIAFSFVQPWWQFHGDSLTPPAERHTAMYINPGVMIQQTTYQDRVFLDTEELPDIFLSFLSAMFPLATLVCVSLSIGIIIKRAQKKTYALLLSFVAVCLLLVILFSFYLGTTKLAETSLGTVFGDGTITVSIGDEDIPLQSSWGFSTGFYLVLIGTIIVTCVLAADVRTTLRQKKKWKTQQNSKQK